MRRDPCESLHRTAADHIRTQTGYLLGQRNVCVVIVAIEGGWVRRSVVENEQLGHRLCILPIRGADTKQKFREYGNPDIVKGKASDESDKNSEIAEDSR